MKNILKLLEMDATLTPECLATICQKEVGELRDAITRWEEEGVILGRQTVIDWDKVGGDRVLALIEVKLALSSEFSYDTFARRIRNYPEVASLYLMSGGFDFAVVVEGEDMRDIANFVGQKLAAQDMVTSTATHFFLNTYKKDHLICQIPETDERENDIL